MKKAVILEHGGGELANQLWNYASIYAYTLESGMELSNPSFFEYGSRFRMPRSKTTERFLFKPFENYTGRRSDLKPRLFRYTYKIWSTSIRKKKTDQVISSINSENKVYYLPPSAEKTAQISKLESENKPIYFVGWLFRNPKGLAKYRESIVSYFRPVGPIQDTIDSLTKTLRTKYEKIIGIHIRQSDYMHFKNGIYYMPQTRVRVILNEYISNMGIDVRKTCFIFTSDGPIQKDLFSGLNIYVSTMSSIHDLFLLSQTDTIIGSDSSFGDFASYYGNIPHIVFKTESIDWEYYKDKKTYFENKYCTLVQY